VADETDINHGFATITPKQDFKAHITTVSVLDAPLDPTQGDNSPYHPHFAHIRSPSDALIRTSDAVLFWFSLSLLSHHSSRFALLDPETLWLRSQPMEFSSVIPVLAIDSRTFAVIAHTLLHNYATVRKAVVSETETLAAGPMPAAVLDPGFIEAFK
jgi:hypothetical protein